MESLGQSRLSTFALCVFRFGTSLCCGTLLKPSALTRFSTTSSIKQAYLALVERWEVIFEDDTQSSPSMPPLLNVDNTQLSPFKRSVGSKSS